MAAPEPPPPWPVEIPPAQAAFTAEIATPAAQSTLGSVSVAAYGFTQSIKNARTAAESWTDEFWALSGYDQAAVMAALDELDAMVATLEAEYRDDLDVLKGA